MGAGHGSDFAAAVPLISHLWHNLYPRYQTADWAAQGSRPTPERRRDADYLRLYAVTDAACDARQVLRTLNVRKP